MENLLEKLERYGKSDFYPLHMPGHKRQMSHFEHPFAIDITEIDGFDNLFHAEEVLLEAQQRAAQLYGAEESFYLVNGSTCGILASVSAAVSRGGRILMARNCHKAAYHAVLLNGLDAEYLYPSADMSRGINGAISVEMVRDALSQQICDRNKMQNNIERKQEMSAPQEADRDAISGDSSDPDAMQAMCRALQESSIEAVLITSPTYDGVVSDIRGIAKAVHQAGAILIVDEAHGAHFAMDPYFPESALACGADLVINSIHKTLPSLTQTALLHVQGTRVDRERLKRYLGIYQSSSPSYVLMAGMDACICRMLKERKELFGIFTRRLERLRSQLKEMKVLHLVDGKEPELNVYDYDRSKVIVSTERSSMNGAKLAKLLRERYYLEAEMEAERYVTAIMTVADTEEGFVRLSAALLEIDSEEAAAQNNDAEKNAAIHEKDPTVSAAPQKKAAGKEQCVQEFCNDSVMTIQAANDSPREVILVEESVHRISAEFVYLYPPGIPILVPGERIPAGLMELLCYDREIGLHVQGMADYSGRTIQVIRESSDGGVCE